MSKYLSKPLFDKEEKKWRKCLGPGGDKCQGQIFTTKYERLCPYCKNKIEYMKSGTLLQSNLDCAYGDLKLSPCFS